MMRRESVFERVYRTYQCYMFAAIWQDSLPLSPSLLPSPYTLLASVFPHTLSALLPVILLSRTIKATGRVNDPTWVELDVVRAD